MQIQNSKLFNFKKVDNAIKGEALAKEMMIFADKNSSAVSKAEFQEKLNSLSKLSTNDLVKFIKNFDSNESIIELICDEIGDDKNTRKEACKKVFAALVNKANELGIDTKDFELQFNEELGSQFGFMGKYIKTEKLDNIVNAITQSIENRANLTQDEIQQIQNTSVEEGENQTNTIIENRLEKAYADFGERVDNNGEMTDKHEVKVPILDKNGNPTGEFETKVETYNGQLQQDGIAADIADGVSRIWGSENTATKVRRDLKIANSQLQELKDASIEGEEAYKAKFKEIFGIEYDYANIAAYQKSEQVYLEAAQFHEFEMMFKRDLKTLLSPAPLRDEVRYDSPDPTTSMVVSTVTATKDQVFAREFEKLASYLGEKGGEVLNKAFEEAGVKNGTMEEKFEVLKQIATALSKEIHSNTLAAGGGKDFATVKNMYENSYKAAYGVENDIMKRVTDYNTSQQVGAGVVKAAGTIAASLTAAFSGVGLVGVAAITAGTTVGVEVVDRGTSGKALNALREDGVGAYIKTANDDIDWEATLKQAVISGGAVLIGGSVAKGVSFIMEGTKPAAQALAQFGADVAFDAGWEYLTTGKITIEGMVFSVLLSAAGNIVAMKQLKAEAADAVDPAKIAQKNSVADLEKKIADIDAKKTLTQNVDELNNLSAQRQVYEQALGVKGLDMMKADGITTRFFDAEIDGFDSNPACIGLKNAEGKMIYIECKDFNGASLDQDLNLLGQEYLKLKTSGADISDLITKSSRQHGRYDPIWRNIEESFTGTTAKVSSTPKTAAETNNGIDAKTRLMSTETPKDFNPTALQQWADDNGLTLSLEGNIGSSKTAIFRDSDGNVVRRLTENSDKLGTVYDDRITYYENGQPVSKKVKYYDEPTTSYYDFDAKADKFNLVSRKVDTPAAAKATAEVPTTAQASMSINEPRNFEEFLERCYHDAFYNKGKFLNSHKLKYNEDIIERIYYAKNADGSRKYSIEEALDYAIELFTGTDQEVARKLLNAGFFAER